MIEKRKQYILAGYYNDGTIDAVPYSTYENAHEIMAGIYEERKSSGPYDIQASYISVYDAAVNGSDFYCVLRIKECEIPKESTQVKEE